MPSVDTYVGPINGATGTNAGELRTGWTGEQITGDGHARFREATGRGNVFSGGMTTTSISSVLFTTATPVIGLWNPLSSDKVLSVLQARLCAILTALQCTGGGSFIWCTHTQQAAITTGLTPINRKTLVAAGSTAKVFASTALTGLVGSMTVRETAGLHGASNYTASLLGTAAGFMPPASPASIENIDGAWEIPPGGVLALLCTTTPVAVSAASAILWEEIPILS